MSVAPISGRRSRLNGQHGPLGASGTSGLTSGLNGTVRSRPSLLAVPAEAPEPSMPERTPPDRAEGPRRADGRHDAPVRANQAVASLLGRSTSRPRTGLFLMSALLLLALAELLLTLIPMLRVIVWGMGLVTALGAAAAGVALPLALLEQCGIKIGDDLRVSSADGEIQLKVVDAEEARQVGAAKQIMTQRADVLRRLAE